MINSLQVLKRKLCSFPKVKYIDLKSLLFANDFPKIQKMIKQMLQQKKFRQATQIAMQVSQLGDFTYDTYIQMLSPINFSYPYEFQKQDLDRLLNSLSQLKIPHIAQFANSFMMKNNSFIPYQVIQQIKRRQDQLNSQPYQLFHMANSLNLISNQLVQKGLEVLETLKDSHDKSKTIFSIMLFLLKQPMTQQIKQAYMKYQTKMIKFYAKRIFFLLFANKFYQSQVLKLQISRFGSYARGLSFLFLKPPYCPLAEQLVRLRGDLRLSPTDLTPIVLKKNFSKIQVQQLSKFLTNFFKTQQIICFYQLSGFINDIYLPKLKLVINVDLPDEYMLLYDQETQTHVPSMLRQVRHKTLEELGIKQLIYNSRKKYFFLEQLMTLVQGRVY